MPKLIEGNEIISDPVAKKIFDEINKEEEELDKNPPAPKEGEEPKPEPKEPPKEPENKQEPLPPKLERPVEHIPAWKLKEVEKQLSEVSSQLDLTKKEREELKTKVDELSRSNVSVDDEVRKYAEEYTADPKAIQDLVGILSKRFTPPEDYQKIIAEQKKNAESERLKQEAFAEFENDFKALAEKHSETANLKEVLKTLAFSEIYSTYSLEHIYRLEKENLVDPKRKTGEGTRGKAEGGKTALKIENIDDMSDKEVMELADKLSAEGSLKRTR